MSLLIHLLGTHALVVSIVAQCFVLYEAIRSGKKGTRWQSGLLIFALLPVVVSIQLRPPSPPNALADGIGVLAAVIFVIPAAIAFRKARAQRPDKQDAAGSMAN
jgi:hypothetical protein